MRGLGAIDGRYVLERRCAGGGMGTVYAAWDRRARRPVALKILGGDAGSADAVAREAALLAELAHPDIVRYLDHGETHEGAPYLVMEWIDGETLDAWLARAGLSAAEAVDLTRRLAGALAAAHARGVIHRDLKPGNVILRDGDLARPCVIDFGIARRLGGPRLTRTGVAVGTPGYMAPEQARGERDVSPAADVFALGCVLYEATTGRAAFPGDTGTAVNAKVVLAEPRPPAELCPEAPPALLRALAALLAKEPADRPPDGAAAASLLATLALPAGPRRRRVDGPDAEATRRIDETPAELLVLLAAPLSTEVAGEAARAGGRPVALVDDAVVRFSSGAAAAAWALGQGGAVVLATTHGLDEAGRRLEAERIAAAAGPPAPGVAIAEDAAAIIGAGFVVEGPPGARRLRRAGS